MANQHPYHMHREHQVGHRRVNHILKSEPSGAKQHAGGHAFSKVTSKTAAAQHDSKIGGHAAPKRYARGGKVKKADGGIADQVNRAAKGDAPARKDQTRYGDAPYRPLSAENTEDNEGRFVARRGPKQYARGGKVKRGDTNIAIVLPRSAAGQTPLMPPGAAGPAGGPPMPPPPGAGGPPGMPPGMPMRARGGKVQPHIDGEASPADIKAWGKRADKNSYFRGGAATGVGREEKAAHMKRKGR